MRGEEFLLQGEQNCGHLSSLSGRAIALGSEPPLVARNRELAWVQSCSSVKKKTKEGCRAVLTRLGDFLFFLFLDSHTTVNNSEVSRVVHSHDLLNLDNVREFLLYLPV